MGTRAATMCLTTALVMSFFFLSWVCMKFQRHISWVVNKTQFKWRKTVFKEKFAFNNISQEDFAVAQLLLVICEIVCCKVKLHKKGKDQRTNIELMTIWTENSHRFEKCHLLAMFCSKMWSSQHHSAPKKRVEEEETSIPVLVVECQFHLFLPLFLSLTKVLSDMLRDMSTLQYKLKIPGTCFLLQKFIAVSYWKVNQFYTRSSCFL